MAGLVFVAAELGLSLMVVMDRLRGIEERLDRADHGTRRRPPAPEPAALEHIRATAPEPRSPFRWLQPGDGKMGVFVPILLGAGVVASALAWLVERIAARTARPAMERSLAAHLSAIAWPAEPLSGEGSEPTGWLAGPRPGAGP